MEAKAKRFGGIGKSQKSGGSIIDADRKVFFDDYARKNQPSPTRRGFAQSYSDGVSASKKQYGGNTTFSRPGTSNQGGACEWDRLMKEREELLKSGAYTEDDPLIQEISRQIAASQASGNAGAGATTFNQRISAQ